MQPICSMGGIAPRRTCGGGGPLKFHRIKSVQNEFRPNEFPCPGGVHPRNTISQRGCQMAPKIITIQCHGSRALWILRLVGGILPGQLPQLFPYARSCPRKIYGTLGDRAETSALEIDDVRAACCAIQHRTCDPFLDSFLSNRCDDEKNR